MEWKKEVRREREWDKSVHMANASITKPLCAHWTHGERRQSAIGNRKKHTNDAYMYCIWNDDDRQVNGGNRCAQFGAGDEPPMHMNASISNETCAPSVWRKPTGTHTAEPQMKMRIAYMCTPPKCQRAWNLSQRARTFDQNRGQTHSICAFCFSLFRFSRWNRCRYEKIIQWLSPLSLYPPLWESPQRSQFAARRRRSYGMNCAEYETKKMPSSCIDAKCETKCARTGVRPPPSPPLSFNSMQLWRTIHCKMFIASNVC